MQHDTKILTKRHWHLVIGGGTLLVIALCVAALYTGWWRNNDMRNIEKTGRLRVAMDNTLFGTSDHSTAYNGFAYEIVKAFADSLGLELEVNIVNDTEAQLQGLLNNEFDLVTTLYPKTEDLAQTHLCSVPFFISRLVLLQQTTAKPWATQSQLGGQSVFVPKNKAYRLCIGHLSDEIADSIHLVEMDGMTHEQLVRMLNNNEISCTICPEMLTRLWTREFPNIRATLPVSFDQQYVWVMPKQAFTLQNKLNSFLKAYMETPTYRAIYSHYF